MQRNIEDDYKEADLVHKVKNIHDMVIIHSFIS